TEEYNDHVIRCMSQTFLRDEPLTNIIGISYETREREFVKIWKNILSQKMSLICLSKDYGREPVVCGVNFTLVLSKNERAYTSKDPKFENFLMALEFIQENGMIFEKLGLDKYLYSFGLYVPPQYRGENVGANLLAARDSLCEAFGLEATATIFSNKYSQRSGKKAGFRNMFEVSYNDFLGKLNVRCDNEHLTSTIKFMCKSYKQY
ncbi:hypothetical protein AMK59_1396, partial [Oryctes borbonicus]